MSSRIDTNVNDYTLAELLTILDLDTPTSETVTAATNKYIKRFTNENNPKLVQFFKDIQKNLLHYVNGLEDPQSETSAEYPPAQRQTDSWWIRQALKQRNPVQSNKNTDRIQKIDVYGNEHVPMNREQLGITNTKSVAVSQDTLNPNLENITTRFINLDSQFRQSTGGTSSLSTDYTLDLSEPLTNVLSLRLYSIQVPYTWYTIDVIYGNTCFWLSFVDITNVTVYTAAVTVTPGNYKPTDFVIELVTALAKAHLTFPANVEPVVYNVNNAKVTLNLYGGLYRDPNNPEITYTIDTTTIITFFDFNSQLLCNSTNCSIQTSAINLTLGWIIGYRLPVITVNQTGNQADAVMDLYGPKYLILVVDDYNQNHINNGLISITELSKVVRLPSYFSPDMPFACSRALSDAANLKITMQNDQLFNEINSNPGPNAGLLLADKYLNPYTTQASVLPTAPRILTQSQIYTINEILKNNEQNTNYRAKAPTTNDVLALIPIKHIGMTTGEMYVDFSGSLQDNKRIYFGPVDIDRLRIRLLDDKGNILNLNGADWCVTLITENLYQY